MNTNFSLASLTLFIGLSLSLCSVELASAQTPCRSLPSGLIAWWPGDGDAVDIVSGASGILRNGATFGPGLVGQAFLLDGVDDVIEIPSSAAPQFAAGSAFTSEMWVYRTSEAFPQHFYGKRNGCGPGLDEWNYQEAIGIGGLSFEAVPIRTWTHLATVYTGTEIKRYTNGVLFSAEPYSNPPPNDAPLLIGSSGSCADFGGAFGGLIDELSFYSRALTEQEIQAIVAAQSSGKCQQDLIRMAIRVSQVEVCWTSRSNVTYQLQYRSTLTTNEWLPLLSCVRATNSTTCHYDSVLVGQPQRFYRAVLTNCVPQF